MFKGYAQADAAKKFLLAKGVQTTQQRYLCDVPVSAVGFGTYLGGMDFNTDRAVTIACIESVGLGVNLIDSAINYRGQRGERSIGEALKQMFLKNVVSREEVFVSTKGGFVPFEGEPVEDLVGLFHQQYVKSGLVADTDLVADCHCMHPAYLNNQLERSRRNLGLETIDLYYIHNPETQLEEFPARLFYERLSSAFEYLESARLEGKIRYYGLATWDGFREPPTAQGHLDLTAIIGLAEKAHKKVSGQGAHGLRAIQLPFNFAMIEAGFHPIQGEGQKLMPTIACAQIKGIDVVVSAPLYQGRLAEGLPPFVKKHFDPALTDAEIALFFATALPGISAALVGMKTGAHVQTNLKVLKGQALGEGQLKELLQSMVARN